MQKILKALKASKKKIDNLNFPGIRILQQSFVILFIVGFFIPALLLQILFSSIEQDWERPLLYIYNLALLRQETFSVAAFSYKYILEQIGFSRGIEAVLLNYDIPPPVSFGNSHLITRQITHQIQNAWKYLQLIDQMQDYQVGNKLFDQARDQCYREPFFVTYMNGESGAYKPDFLPQEISFVPRALSHFLNDLRDLLDVPCTLR